MKRWRRIFVRTFAFARKEFKLGIRYRWAYISRTVVLPILHILPFIVLIGGFVYLYTGLEEVNPENYLAWLFLGSLVYTVFSTAYSIFKNRFRDEKYWKTINGTLIAPVSKFYLLFGNVLQLASELLITSGIFLVIAYIGYPTAFLNIFIAFLIIVFTLIGAAGIGLINGAFYLINENYPVIFEYILYLIVFLSCYSIPFEIYPEFLQPIINFNPLYHLITLTRSAWFGEFYSQFYWSLLFVVVFFTICVIIGVYFFSKSTRKFGVRGY